MPCSEDNGPFPSPLVPLFQNESTSETIQMKISLIYMKTNMYAKLIGRFPFDKIFRFEIPGIPCDEWNSIFRFLGLTRSRSMIIKFQVSRENTKSNGGLFVYLLSGCSIDDAEVKINHVLGEGDIITFIVRI